MIAAHIKWPSLNLDYGFMLEIKSELELHDYWLNGRKPAMQRGFSEGIQAIAGKTHATSGDGALLYVSALVECERDNPRSAVQLWCDIQDGVFASMVRCIKDTGAVYVNRNGAYMTLVKDMQVIRRQVIPDYRFPDANDIAVRQWPGGHHWYAYVGGQSIEFNGTNKWLTKEGAELAAKCWLEESHAAL